MIKMSSAPKVCKQAHMHAVVSLGRRKCICSSSTSCEHCSNTDVVTLKAPFCSPEDQNNIFRCTLDPTKVHDILAAMMTGEKSSKSTGVRIEQTHRDAENRMERGGGEELSGVSREGRKCLLLLLLLHVSSDRGHL